MKLIGLFVLYNPPASNSNYIKKKTKTNQARTRFNRGNNIIRTIIVRAPFKRLHIENRSRRSYAVPVVEVSEIFFAFPLFSRCPRSLFIHVYIHIYVHRIIV